MADFRVYYDAANALLHGNTLYGKAFGVSSGFYKYSPFACIPFIPLAVLPYSIASVIYYGITAAAIIFFSVRVSTYLQGTSANQRLLLPLLAGLFLIDHLERELHLGNINLILLIALFETFIALKSNQNIRGGVFYGLVLLFKPHFVLLLPYFIWKKRFKTVAASVASVAFGLFLPAVALGWKENMSLLNKWFGAMSDHNLALQRSPNTIYGLLNNTFLDGQAGSWLIAVTLLLVAVLVAIFILRNDRIAGEKWSTNLRYQEFFLLIALVPSLVHTDTEHFMWIWPLLALSIYGLLNKDVKQTWLGIILLALAFIPFAINSPDLVGNRLQLLFDEGGIGLGNLLIIAAALMVNTRQ
jgi:alpha-1,2-mannosyltransferase